MEEEAAGLSLSNEQLARLENFGISNCGQWFNRDYLSGLGWELPICSVLERDYQKLQDFIKEYVSGKSFTLIDEDASFPFLS